MFKIEDKWKIEIEILSANAHSEYLTSEKVHYSNTQSTDTFHQQNDFQHNLYINILYPSVKEYISYVLSNKWNSYIDFQPI